MKGCELLQREHGWTARKTEGQDKIKRLNLIFRKKFRTQLKKSSDKKKHDVGCFTLNTTELATEHQDSTTECNAAQDTIQGQRQTRLINTNKGTHPLYTQRYTKSHVSKKTEKKLKQ